MRLYARKGWTKLEPQVMVTLRDLVPGDARLRRRCWAGVGLVATGGAMVVGATVAIASRSFQVQSTSAGSSGLGGGSASLSLNFLGPADPLLAFWIALGLVPLVAVFVARAAWPAWALSLFLALLVASYAFSGLAFGPFPSALFALCLVVLLGASLNCLGSLLLRRTTGRWWAHDLTQPRRVPPPATRILVPRRPRT